MFYAHSVLLDKDAVVVWGNSPVLRVIVLVWVVFLVVGEEIVKLYALFEILDGFEASNVLEEVEISIDVDASSDESMPVDALQLNVGVVLLELEVNRRRRSKNVNLTDITDIRMRTRQRTPG